VYYQWPSTIARVATWYHTVALLVPGTGSMSSFHWLKRLVILLNITQTSNQQSKIGAFHN